jgi:macrolide transport system ATP-binding/permease protein
MLTAMANDVRYSLRSLAKSPGFTLAAVLTIALGIGVNTGIFSILNGLAFRDLPVPQARDLVAVNQRVEGVGRGTHNAGQASTFEYETFRDRSETLDGLIGYVGGWEAVLDGEFREEIVGSLVTCNYFDVLRLRPRLGPGLRAEHCENPSLSSVVILSHGLWSRHFGQDESIINRTVTLNGNAVTVVGVAPEGFDGTDLERADYFLPISAQALIRPDRDYLTNGVIAWLRMIGRRKPQATTEQVQAELAIIARQFDQAQPGRETTLTVQRATQVAVPGLRGPILSASAVIMTAFALVLLVACTNVANLFLVRGDNRARELAIRMSLGATRSALVRQLLTESLIVAVVGGVIGSLFALWAFRVLVTLALGALPGEVQSFLRIDPSPDVRVFLFAFAVSLATGLIFGLAPALRSTRPNLRTTIDRDTAATGSDTRGRLQRVLVGVQVAVCAASMRHRRSSPDSIPRTSSSPPPT